MSHSRNRELMQHVYEELSKRNSRPFVASLADDVNWRVIGTTSFSQIYRGKQQVLGDLIAKVMAALDGGIRVTVDRIIAGGDWVVIEGRGEARTKTGKQYNNTYCWVHGLDAEGLIREVTEYCDTELVRECLSEAN
jgi:ketosteroid isomerase-like protein